MNAPSTVRGIRNRVRRAAPNRVPGTRIRLVAVGRFLLFAIVMGTALVGIRLALSKVPDVAPLLRSANEGYLSPGLLWIVDPIGFLAVLAYCAVAARIEKRSLGVYGLPRRIASGKSFARGMAFGLALASLDIGITWLMRGFSFGGIALGPQQALRYGLEWGGGFLLGALFEEYLFRGYALNTLAEGIGFWPAALLLAIVFGGLHLPNAGENIIGALDVVAYALFASFTLLRTGSLWFAVGVHAAWDFSLTFLFSVPGSGLNAHGVLLHSALHGHTWLTGGSAGPEGSAVGLAVLIAAFFACSTGMLPLPKSEKPEQ
jgi:CAAX protease family protein